MSRLFAPVLAVAGAALGAPLVDVAVNWPSFLERSDPTWTELPTKWYESAFVGNGKLGAMVSVDPASQQLQLALGSSAVWDDRPAGAPFSVEPDNFVCNRPRLPLGRFVLASPGAALAGDGFGMRLNLWDAEVTGAAATASGGRVGWRVFAHAVYDEADVLAVELTHGGNGTAAAAAAAADAWRWEPAPAESTWKSRCEGYVENPPITNVTMPGDGAEVWTQAHLLGTEHATAFLAVPGGKAGSSSSSSSSSSTLGGQGDVTSSVMYVSTSSVLGAGQGAAAALGAVRAAAAAGHAALLASHRSWWHDYYPRSFLTLAEPMIESFYWTQMYKLASATRADRVVYDLMGPWYVDRTDWPDLHWDLNLQLTYWPMFTSNRLDLVNSLTGLLDAETPNLVRNVPVEWRADAAAAPAGASSLELQETCYWNHGVEFNGTCLTTPPTVTGNLLWVMQLWHNVYRYKGHAAAELARLFPLLARAVNYYRYISYNGTAEVSGPADAAAPVAAAQPSPVLHLNATMSPEYASVGDCNYDVALLRWGLGAALGAFDAPGAAAGGGGAALPAAMAAAYEAAGDVARWRDMAARLTPYPTDEATGFLIGEGMPLAHGHRHFSHLMMLFPLKSLDLGDGGGGDGGGAATPDAAVARKSLDHWLGLTDGLTGFCRTAASSMNVMLGRRPAARTNLTYLLDSYILPNTMYHEGEQGACGETPPAAASAVMDWLLMEWGGVTRVFPGVDDGATADAAFAGLLAPGGFEFTAQRRDNATSFVAVTNAGAGGNAGAKALSIRVDAMPLPWTVAAGSSGSVSFAPRADGSGVVDIDLATFPQGASVAFYSSAAPPALPLTIAPSTSGDPSMHNFWGLPKGPPPPPTPAPPPPVPSHPCADYGGDASPPGYGCRGGYCVTDRAAGESNCGVSLAEPALDLSGGCSFKSGTTAALTACAAAAAAACDAQPGCGSFALDPLWTAPDAGGMPSVKLFRDNGSSLTGNAGWNVWVKAKSNIL